MFHQPNPLVIDPPSLTVDPPAIRVTPPSFTVTPPAMTVQPPAVSFKGKPYQPPGVTVSPPPVTVNLPALTVDPPAIVVDVPTITVPLPAVEVTPAVGQNYVIVDPPAVTVDPPAITITPPAITVTPPAVRVDPPALTVPASSFKVRIGPASFDVPVPSFRADPPAFTVTPPPLTIQVPPVTVNPPPLTIDPPAVVVNLGDFTWGSPRYTTLVSNGKSANRLDVVFIGDGYTAAQQTMFNGDVQTVIAGFRTTAPMSAYYNHFNFHRVNVISPEDGTDDMYAHPPAIRRTALHTFFSPIAERRLVGPDPWVKEVVRQSGAPCDEIVVLVNAPRRGGATAPTMEIAYASRNSHDFPAIVIHEAGHSIANLMDEYDNFLPDIDWPSNWVLPSVLPWVNVDTDPHHPKWQPWLTPGVQLPTPGSAPVGTVGAFQGAAYTASGVYRPTQACMMRDHDDPFCVVCAEAWIAAIYRRSRLADAFFPQASQLQPLRFSAGRLVTFSAQVVRPADVWTTWFTKDRSHLGWQQRQQTNGYQPFTAAFAVSGAGQVRVVLEDLSDRIRTPEVRSLARQEFVWDVTIV